MVKTHFWTNLALVWCVGIRDKATKKVDRGGRTKEYSKAVLVFVTYFAYWNQLSFPFPPPTCSFCGILETLATLV